MNLNLQQISMLKKGLIGYWVSVAVVAVLFIEAPFAQKYVLFAALIFLAHVIETFLFDKTLQEHSDNVIRDKLLMLPFGFLIPAGLKAQAAAKAKEGAND